MEDLLKKLVEAPAISGCEKNVRDLIEKEIKPYVDTVRTDRIGNLIAKKGDGKPKIMLAAHMDEIGLMVKYVEDEGFIRFEPVGRWDKRILLAQKVKIHGSKGEIVGIVGSRPFHIQEPEEEKKTVEIKDMFIDIGAKNKKEVEKAGISQGDFITICGEFDKLAGNRVTGRNFDDRIGCLLLIEIMRSLKKFEGTVYAVGTIEEEIGLVGVRGSTYGINPDVMLALDISIAGDTPGIKPEEVSVVIGKGPVVEIKDQASVIHPKVKKWITSVAKQNKIPLQYNVFSGGATDASVVPTIREGIPAGAVSIPTRYVHTPVEVIDMNDVKNCISLITKTIQTAKNYF